MAVGAIRPRLRAGLLTLAAMVALAASSSPRVQGTDQFGERHDLAGESYTVVDFAASWCDPCYRALPELQALAADTPKVRFLVVSIDDEVTGRDRLIEDLGLRLPVIWDAGHELIERFHPEGFPATYVLAPGGEIVHHHVGYSKKKWRRLVDVLKGLDVVAAPRPESPGDRAGRVGRHRLQRR